MVAVLLSAAFAGLIGGTVGFGTVLFIVPALSALIGVQAAIPLLSIIALVVNGLRAALSWREIDWLVVRRYGWISALCALPTAWIFPQVPASGMAIFLGFLTLIVVPARRFAQRRQWQLTERHLPALGVGVGLLTGTGATIGPATAPFLLSYGLRGPAFIGTEAVASTMTQASKSSVFFGQGLIRSEHLTLGLAILVVLATFTAIGKLIVERLDAERFTLFVEAACVVAGLALLVQGWQLLAR